MSLEDRIEKMYKSDVRNATILITVLWLVILFVLFSVWPIIPLGSIRITVAIGAGLLLLFNTAAIIAMLRHYKEDKRVIYEIDIHFLDEIAERKKGGK